VAPSRLESFKRRSAQGSTGRFPERVCKYRAWGTGYRLYPNRRAHDLRMDVLESSKGHVGESDYPHRIHGVLVVMQVVDPVVVGRGQQGSWSYSSPACDW
jgi:hypothetical protein